MSGIKEAKRKRIEKYKKRRKRRRIKRILALIGILVVILGIVLIIKAIFKDSPEKEEKEKATITDLVLNNEEEEKEETMEPVEITVSMMGDCTLGRDANNNYSTSLNAYYESHGADYFFQNVRSILEQDDLSIVNMEGTFTDSDLRAEKQFAFKAPSDYAAILTGSSVEAANLANNHSKDYGLQSYEDTISVLDEAGIVNFGYDRVQIMEINGVKVGLTGVYELAEGIGAKDNVIANIAALKEQGAQLIIVSFHWGTEKEYWPDSIQKELAHTAIDEGADLVVGHHPHVLQGIEKYKGKYIAYSLGNFCFGGNKNPTDKDTMIFQQTFTVTEEGAEINDNINIIPCSLSSVSSHNDYCPTPLEGDAGQRVKDKIDKYSEGLSTQPDPEPIEE